MLTYSPQEKAIKYNTFDEFEFKEKTDEVFKGGTKPASNNELRDLPKSKKK